jgi:hypothetical protein
MIPANPERTPFCIMVTFAGTLWFVVVVAAIAATDHGIEPTTAYVIGLVILILAGAKSVSHAVVEHHISQKSPWSDP